MKIKAKKYEPSYKKVIVDNYEFMLDEKTMVRANNYIPIMAMQFNDDGTLDIITTVLNKDYKKVIPLRKERQENTDFGPDDVLYDIMLFENDKCVYILGKDCYLIDLKNTVFDGYIPINYLRKFDCLYNRKDGNAIIYDNSKAYLLDVVNNKKLSKTFDYIKPTKKENEFEAYYLIPSKYFYPLFAKLDITYDGIISNKVQLGNSDITLFLDDKILNNKKELLKYCDDAFIKSLENKGNKKCKTMIQ